MPLARRLAPLLLLLAAALALHAFGLTRHLSAEGLAGSQATIEQFVAAHRWPAVAAFVLLFMTVTAAFIPAALLLTLMGGFVFGPWIGTGATVLGATLGAIITFATVRTAAGEWLHKHVASRHGHMEAVMDGVERHAFFYVLALRLTPLLPFGLVNIAAGLSKAPLRPYALATLLGAIPTSFIYSQLGAGAGGVIARGGSLGAALMQEPGVLWSLAALACLALAPVLLRGRLRGRR
jgi:uncharacterized membrane protein YdjX (TVP38/TMEM64 family)